MHSPLIFDAGDHPSGGSIVDDHAGSAVGKRILGWPPLDEYLPAGIGQHGAHLGWSGAAVGNGVNAVHPGTALVAVGVGGQQDVRSATPAPHNVCGDLLVDASVGGWQLHGVVLVPSSSGRYWLSSDLMGASEDDVPRQTVSGIGMSTVAGGIGVIAVHDHTTGMAGIAQRSGGVRQGQPMDRQTA